MLPTLTLNLTVTKACNFACSYCFETGKHEKKYMSIEAFDKIIDFMKKNKYHYNLFLIGGEPTLSPHLSYFLKKVKEEVQKNNISLIPLKLGGSSVLITNGFSYKNILKSISEDENEEDFEFWKKYLDIQVSYDGKVIQDKYRKTINGITTSDKVLKTINELYKNKFNVSSKSTLNIYDFKHIKEVLDEFKELKLKYNIDYNVTENKDSFKFLNKEDIREIIESYFPYVLKHENSFFKENREFFTRWFNESSFEYTNQYCSAGVSMIHIDPEGNVTPCHLSLYVNDTIHYGNFFKEQKKTLEQMEYYKKYFIGQKEDKCKDCTALFCLRCPVSKYSEDKNLHELYNGINDKICFYYQEISKYIYYLKKKLNLL